MPTTDDDRVRLATRKGNRMLGPEEWQRCPDHPRKTEQQARIRVTLMHAALERLAGPESYTHPDACSVVDLATGRTRKGAARWRDIEAACDEIRRSWATV